MSNDLVFVQLGNQRKPLVGDLP